MDQEKNEIPVYVSNFEMYQRALQKEIQMWERNVRLLNESLGKRYLKDPDLCIFIEDIGKLSYGGAVVCHFSEKMAKEAGKNPSCCDFCPAVMCGNGHCEERDNNRKMVGVWGLFDNSLDYLIQGNERPRIQMYHVEAATAILLWLRKTKFNLQKMYSQWYNGGD